MTEPQFREVPLRQEGNSTALLQAVRSLTATVECVFVDGDADHPLAAAMAPHRPVRTEGVGPRPGYHRGDPGAVLLRCAYDREIFRTITALGGLFEYVEGPGGDRVFFTELGNVDLSLYDVTGHLILYTVTHEGLVFVAEAVAAQVSERMTKGP